MGTVDNFKNEKIDEDSESKHKHLSTVRQNEIKNIWIDATLGDRQVEGKIPKHDVSGRAVLHHERDTTICQH
jgi:hypothetical protein